MTNPITILGAGLAGCEAAWQLAETGIAVTLVEQKPTQKSPAHQSDDFAELVCSNSLRSDRPENAAGLLKSEMRKLNSLIIQTADETAVDAGGALAVDRAGFAKQVTDKLRNHPLITIESREATAIPNGVVIIATGPLTSDGLATAIGTKTGGDFLHFFDAAAPIVSFDSIDLSRAYFAARYDKGTPDYLNCGMTREEYQTFYQALIQAETAPVHAFEQHMVFEGCMPVEVMAARGVDTLRFGPLKPVGLDHPETKERYYAVVQLRRDNVTGTMYNLVGFQTRLTFGAQKRVFSMIPGLENAEFLRYGVMHRNTYMDSPRLLDRYYRLKSDPRIRFAGQITGVEGYVESAASGLLCALETARQLQNQPPIDFPQQTAIGALALYASDESVGNFQPMNVNFGIIPPLEERIKNKQERNLAIANRSLAWFDDFAKKENLS